MDGFIDLSPVRVIEESDPLGLPDNHNAHQLLQALYRCKALPVRERARYAIASLPYETPKLAVTASVQEYQGWVERMDQAIEQSNKVLQARKINGEWSADDTAAAEPVDRDPQSSRHHVTGSAFAIGKPFNRRI
jgi:hypothetical protein